MTDPADTSGEKPSPTAATAESSGKNSGRKMPLGKPFQKGRSGNPGGRRPVDPEAKAILRAATPQAALRLIELMSSPDDAVALKACVEIINRELGKAVEKHEHAVTVTSLAEDLMAAQARLAAERK